MQSLTEMVQYGNFTGVMIRERPDCPDLIASTISVHPGEINVPSRGISRCRQPHFRYRIGNLQNAKVEHTSSRVCLCVYTVLGPKSRCD